MSEFWGQLLLMLGSNAMLLGLVGYLGKIYLDRIARNEQSTIDSVARGQQSQLDAGLKRLEQRQEDRLTKNEHFHQISQQTYQKLFDKKVEIYGELFTLVSDIESEYPYMPNHIFEKVLTDQKIGTEEILLSAHGMFVYKKYVKLNLIFNKNLSLLSPELVDRYFIWRSNLKPDLDKIREKDLVATSALINNLDEYMKLEDNTTGLLAEKIKADRNMTTHVTDLKKVIVYQNNIDSFELIVEQIKIEIKALNQRIDSLYNLFETEEVPIIGSQDTL